MIDAATLYGDEANTDPLRSQFEEVRALLDSSEWRRALRELEALSQQGSLLSTLCLAGCMLEGWRYDQDLRGAEAWYRAAAEAGSTAGLFGLGITHVRLARFSDALGELYEAAELGHAPAYNALAYLYLRGEGAPVDHEQALALWRAGARAGHLPAKRNMVWALIQGYGGLRGRIEGLLGIVPVSYEVARAKRTERRAESD